MQSEPVSAETAGRKRASPGFAHVLTTFQRWWHTDVTGTVDQIAVIEKRRAECATSARYLLMTCMSAGIAILGLLQGSAAVVIGAMLLSPLMDPIMGVGFALAIGDFQWLRQSARSLAIGVVVAIAFTALVVFISPLQTITAEIASRTRPSLLDLGVAVFSSIAGAYAMIRGREGTIVGVAIATALMPPLAVVGFGVATLNATVFWGSLFLFITNLTAIALTATIMARAYGFSTSLSDKHTKMQNFLIFAAFTLLAIPLFLSLRQIVWESQATRQANNVVIAVYDQPVTISELDMNYDMRPIRLTATVLTPQYVENAEARAEVAMSRELGRPVEVSLTQVRVGTTAQAQQEAQLGEARRLEAESRAQARDIAEDLAMLAGVTVDDVTVDRERRRAIVIARPLEGATMTAYRELEQRINAGRPAWDIRFTPPIRPLPDIPFERETGEDADDDGWVATDDGRDALALAAWAQQRVGVPVRLVGPRESVAHLRAILAADGDAMQASITGEGYGDVAVEWTTQ
ncbi:TIGR00341 family protein [Aurantiacibacter gangjinensis]|uniref:Membrane protein n=1 Tax=Aurantiacibacter gangjinensis TaxID=502682 RepID=A0A0G9MMH0_9SPHN|nr:TIGR00341 family protein [Aurantiacibacter gangjinensis]APE27821.1 hypothetical protein BMF35_a0992 [Aurantiacibacter gangjinensis]KLE31804.1 membrane protein [Aurantiacibacter gangjinensis]